MTLWEKLKESTTLDFISRHTVYNTSMNRISRVLCRLTGAVFNLLPRLSPHYRRMSPIAVTNRSQACPDDCAHEWISTVGKITLTGENLHAGTSVLICESIIGACHSLLGNSHSDLSDLTGLIQSSPMDLNTPSGYSNICEYDPLATR